MKLTPVVIVLALASSAFAQKRAQSVCSTDIMPIAEDSQWTYRSDTDEVTLTVKSATPEHIQVEEKQGDRVLLLSWTCGPDGLVVPPSSFLWAGEFGGGVGMDVTIDSREGATFPTRLRPGSQHSENIRGTVTRKDTAGHGAVLPDAKLDLQRNLVHQGTERLTVGDTRVRAQRVAVDLRGNVSVDGEVSGLPVKQPGMLWFVPRQGIVRLMDTKERVWDLVPAS